MHAYLYRPNFRTDVHFLGTPILQTCLLQNYIDQSLFPLCPMSCLHACVSLHTILGAWVILNLHMLKFILCALKFWGFGQKHNGMDSPLSSCPEEFHCPEDPLCFLSGLWLAWVFLPPWNSFSSPDTFLPFLTVELPICFLEALTFWRCFCVTPLGKT